MTPNGAAAESNRYSTIEVTALPVAVGGRAVVEPPSSSIPSYRDSQIALTAYFLAEKRGFSPGGELDDWLAAEHREGRSTD